MLKLGTGAETPATPLAQPVCLYLCAALALCRLCDGLRHLLRTGRRISVDAARRILRPRAPPPETGHAIIMQGPFVLH